MPRLSQGLNAALGNSNSSSFSFNGEKLYWNASASLPALVGQEICGSNIAWLNRWTVVFDSCQSGTCRLYTYDTRTLEITQVATSGATTLYADGGVWAKWLDGTGYEDSLGRVHTDYGVAGVDTNGTVLVILNQSTNTGLGYLTKPTTNANNVTVICYDQLQQSISASIRSGVVIYHANDALHHYNIQLDQLSSSNAPVLLVQNDGDWIVATDTLGLGQIVFNFFDTTAWRIGPANINYAPDIRITNNKQQLNVVTSSYPEEPSTSIRRYAFNLFTAATDTALQQYDLYTHKFDGRPIISATTTPVDYGMTVRASDVITIREDDRYIINDITSQFDGVETEFSLLSGTLPVEPGSAQNLLVSLGGVIQEPEVVYSVAGSTITFTSPPANTQSFFAVLLSAAVSGNTNTRGFAQVISGTDWFGANGGADIRGTWQYNTTAVVTSVDSTGNTNVTVKDSNNNTWVANEAAYGNAAVMIRPDPSSTSLMPLWEVTWVRNATTYAQVTLDATLVNTAPIAQYTTITFNTSGILDINPDTNLPIPAYGNTAVWYGYVQLEYPMTRGDWTVGKDVSIGCPSNVQRLVAWNSNTELAYVVWNANTGFGSITAPAHITLEYQNGGRNRAAIVPATRTLLIREHQWQLLTENALRFGRAPGTS